ncbi:hypothetical protein GYN07_20780 [Rhizobium leguminosarum bv. viciae 248]|uniref:hypothetical protein n=1 Tax=Rhizobium leguminosarum TaxID=384 RepID=UPI000360109C|nr:hypothetical protein [Rhizobium leguminosarum]QHW26619.1 hypothetical protein GYN07_20780 [Rhizobium leguminosarum bv. viciae 248]
MITEANRHEVAILFPEAARSANKFSAISLALLGVDDDISRSSLDELRRGYAGEVDTYFNRIASLLGYTVSRVDQVEDAA